MGFPSACLFDLDGLLIDTEPLHSQAWSQAAQHFGLVLSDTQLQALRGRRRLDCAAQVQTWIADADLLVPSLQALLTVRQPIAEVLLPRARPIAGAEALLQLCQASRIPMAMVTSSSRAAVALKEAPHPWLGVIGLRVHGDDPELVAGKPAPDPYLLAAQRLGVPASACWAFEDSLAGAQSAAAAGCLVHVLLPSHDQPSHSRPLQWPSGSRLLSSLGSVQFS
ncbi:MAG: HAD family phosphatase [Cyanobacteria bacterium K_DeepCast_35m_m2_023]|nr:HAD family phosphatase [Cyanobacteria bacterium K_DeepCast_35m_m2_023]